jgi:hypothetical protein
MQVADAEAEAEVKRGTKPDGMLSSTKPSGRSISCADCHVCSLFLLHRHRNTKSQWNITLLPMYERYDGVVL